MTNQSGSMGNKGPLKFVQISTTSSGSDGYLEHEVFGLTAEGAVYQYCYGRERLKTPKDIPGTTTKELHGPAFFWWQPLRMSDEKGAEDEIPATPKEFFED